MKITLVKYNFFFLVSFLFGIRVAAQKNSGIFYSTLFAKQKILKRIQNFGDGAEYCFFKDVNGDGKDDAIAIYTDGEKRGKVYISLSDGVVFTKPVYAFTFLFQFDFVHPIMGDLNGDQKADILFIDSITGRLYVAFSDGSSFKKPVLLKSSRINGPVAKSFLADMNGDGKDDLIYYISAGENARKWFVAISKGKGFETPYLITRDFGTGATQMLVADVNGDGYADLIAYYDRTGTWKVALSNGIKCLNSSVWATNFGSTSKKKGYTSTNRKPVCAAYDINNDGKDDIIIWNKNGNCNWNVAYSSGKSFTGYHPWITDFLKAAYKNNVTVPVFGMVGSMDGNKAVAMVVSRGKWLALGNTDKFKTVNPEMINTWEAWGNDYIPDGGTYDTGDSLINDRQIKQIHNAGFTYITLDITNGSNDWVDSRAKDFMERVRIWNLNLKHGDHKMYVNISLGRTRDIEAEDNFFTKLNLECKRAWNEFYLPYKDIYYTLNGKPLVIHMINTGWEYVRKINSWKGDKSFIDKFTNRWMDGIQTGADKDKPNTYGWIVPGINTFDKEMMPLMPGFWNGLTWYDRNEGEMYRNQWLRVFQYQPASVWVNSFNETWEHTSVEPSYHAIDQFVANPLFTKPWTDYYGNRMDDFYWIMTIQYNRLFMDNMLFKGSYIQEYGDDTIWKVTADGFKFQSALPVMAPVLLLPKGFRKKFHGEIIQDNIK